jgi:MFS family permease
MQEFALMPQGSQVDLINPEGSRPDHVESVSSLEIGKIVIRGIGVLYVIGFLVVTFHLAQFGFVSVNWLRPQYLLAGIWCLLPVLVFIGCLALAGLHIVRPWMKYSNVVPKRTRRNRYVKSVIQGVIGIIGATVFVSSLISLATGQPIDARWIPSIAITLRLAGLSLAAFVLGTLGIAGFGYHRREEETRSDRYVARISGDTVILLMALVVGMGYIRYFSIKVYSTIPLTFGGGRPQTVVFLFDKSHSDPAPVAADGSGSRSVPYHLLLKTENTYVVQSQANGEEAIEFRQDSVRGMIMLQQK